MRGKQLGAEGRPDAWPYGRRRRCGGVAGLETQRLRGCGTVCGLGRRLGASAGFDDAGGSPGRWARRLAGSHSEGARSGGLTRCETRRVESRTVWRGTGVRPVSPAWGLPLAGFGGTARARAGGQASAVRRISRNDGRVWIGGFAEFRRFSEERAALFQQWASTARISRRDTGGLRTFRLRELSFVLFSWRRSRRRGVFCPPPPGFSSAAGLAFREKHPSRRHAPVYRPWAAIFQLVLKTVEGLDDAVVAGLLELRAGQPARR